MNVTFFTCSSERICCIVSFISASDCRYALMSRAEPSEFTKEFAESLDKICPLQVKEAADNDLVKTGRILIAQGGKHLKFEKKSQ